MRLQVTPGGVPPGSYTARLADVENVIHEQYGPGLKFTFAVQKGQHLGMKVSRTTSCAPSPRNALGKLLSGMLGRPLTVDEEIELEDLIGRDYLVVVAATEGGGSRVETVVTLPTD
jgi:hypothetical protein